MKRLLVIFGILYNFMPLVCQANQTSSAYEWQCINKIDDLELGWRFTYDDFFCASPKKQNGDKWDGCFHADSSACVNKTTVCILGNNIDINTLSYEADGVVTTPQKTPENTYTFRGVLVGYRACAISYEGSGSDNWYKHKTKAIQDCTDAKWKKDTNKTAEVMVINNKAYIDEETNLPLNYWVKYYDTPTYPDICIGYYCKDGNGKYTEPCDDGTCGSNCQKTNTSNTNTNNKHRGTAQGYLNSLANYCGTINSK